MRGVTLALLLCVACGGGDDAGALSRKQLAEACARLTACRPPALAALSATVCAALPARDREALAASFRDAARCAEKAGGDCAAALACYDGGEPTTGCTAGAPPFCLDDKRLWSCLAGVALETDCGREGLSCVPSTGAAMVAACGEEACDAAAFVARCAGEQRVACQDGVAVRVACPEGAKCVDGACVGLGAPCVPAAPDRCDGTGLVSCVGGAEARRDCAAGGYQQSCAEPAGAPACVGGFAECDPAGFRDRCNGPRLEYCQDGRVLGLDCDALGFLGCEPAGAGMTAHCRAAMPFDMPDAGVPDAGVPDAALSDGAPE